MPNKLTDAEIKKALGICASGNLGCEDGCPLKEMNCRFEMPKLALDLINRQQAELDKYEQIKITINEFWDILLKFSIIKRKEKPTLEEFAEAIQEIKAEAYKEFANELKCRTHEISYNTMLVVNKDDIDNLLNELVGDSK